MSSRIAVPADGSLPADGTRRVGVADARRGNCLVVLAAVAEVRRVGTAARGGEASFFSRTCFAPVGEPLALGEDRRALGDRPALGDCFRPPDGECSLAFPARLIATLTSATCAAKDTQQSGAPPSSNPPLASPNAPALLACLSPRAAPVRWRAPPGSTRSRQAERLAPVRRTI